MARIAEEKRLSEALAGVAAWRRWGPYLAAREWGTAREHDGGTGSPWESFPHDQARSRAYRDGEDAIAGLCDDEQRLCFGLALWNGVDPILKERFFGSSPAEGNHGEDAKEYWFHADATPTHSYLRFLYKYPMAPFPYGWFANEARRRGGRGLEPELVETGIFDAGRYWDVEVEYAKASPEDVLVRITAHNRSPERATLHLLPSLWFRNTWSESTSPVSRPTLTRLSALGSGFASIEASHPTLGPRWLHAECSPVKPDLLFTGNDTRGSADSMYAKDAIGERVVHGRARVNPAHVGTKAAAWYRLEVDAGKSVQVSLRLRDQADVDGLFGGHFDGVFRDRIREADEHWKKVEPPGLAEGTRALFRQSLAGLLWSEQHVQAGDVVCVPDKWEQPALSAWDLAFLAVPLALVDAELAKRQVRLPLHDRHRLAGGLDSAPVLAWAALQVYTIERRRTGHGDRHFLQAALHELVSAYDEWAKLPDVGAGSMAAFALRLFAIATELTGVDRTNDPAYEVTALSFLERFAGFAALWDGGGGGRGELSKLDDLLPVTIAETVSAARLERATGVREAIEALGKKRPAFASADRSGNWRLSLLGPEELAASIGAAFDEAGLLSPFGLRTLSKRHPLYEPAEPSADPVNVNRRGAVWLPMNFLIVDALQKHGEHHGASLTIELGGARLTLAQAAATLSRRMQSIFLRGADGRRPVHGGTRLFQEDARWKDLFFAYESFHGDEGAGLGASHCASTALLAALMANGNL